MIEDHFFIAKQNASLSQQQKEIVDCARIDYYGDDKTLLFQSAFSKIIECLAKQIRLSKNLIMKVRKKWKSFIYDAVNVSFPDLEELFLSQNSIDSVQLFSRIRIPNLKVLDFGINNISSVRSLKKEYWPQLARINFYDNQIKDSQELRKFCSNEIIEVTLEWRLYEPALCEDINWIFKIKAQNLGKLYIKSRHRIRQRAKDLLEVKYQQITIY